MINLHRGVKKKTMKFKLINDYGLYIMHVTDINNSILINKEIFDRLEKKRRIKQIRAFANNSRFEPRRSRKI